MNKESFFISKIASKKSYISDDAVAIDSFLYSKDAFFEDVHFKKEWLSYYEVAYKSILINISDAIAMNAKPLYALIALAYPSSIKFSELEELSLGFKDACSKYGVEIIGGDTISNTKLDISVTIVSKERKNLYRTTRRKNLVFAYTGSVGKSKKELNSLFRGGSLPFKSKFKKPTLRDVFIQKVRNHIEIGMDISDGVYDDLSKLSRLNNFDYKFYDKNRKKEFCSGEEYEMLIAFDQRDLKKVKRVSEQTRVKLNLLATSKRGKFNNICKAHHK